MSQPLSLNDHGSLFPSWQRHDDEGSKDSIYPTTDDSDDDNLSNDGNRALHGPGGPRAGPENEVW